jgi:hypothetical protein
VSQVIASTQAFETIDHLRESERVVHVGKGGIALQRVFKLHGFFEESFLLLFPREVTPFQVEYFEVIVM